MHITVQRVWGRIRRGWRVVLEATVAATIAWYVAADVLGHQQPFFAPAAALIVLGAARGQRRWRAAEIVVGVAAGVLVADGVAAVLGPGSTLTVFVVVLLTSVTAVAFGVSTVVLVQAMVSALYVAVVVPPTTTLVPLRFIDALVGGAVALVVTLLLGPRDPVAPAVDAAAAVFDEAAAILQEAAGVLAASDESGAVAVLGRARSADRLVERLRAELAAAHDSSWLSRSRSPQAERLERIEALTTNADYLVRNVRVLSRATVGLVRRDAPPPGELIEAVRRLSAGVGTCAGAVRARTSLDPARAATLEAVGLAAEALPSGVVLPQMTLVSQVRATAVDLLRVTGLADRESLDLVDATIGG